MRKRDRTNPLSLHRHIWPVFRRKLFDAVSCGASRRWRDEIPEAKPTPPPPRPRSDNRLSELLRSEAGEEDRPALSEEEARRKTEKLEGLQRVVRGLQEDERAAEAAAEVRRLAKADADARRTLALLGAIPPLIGLLESGDPDLLVSSLYALLNLGIGNDMNKAAIVKAGALHKMLRLVEEEDAACTISEAVAANLLGLSALDSNKPVVGAAPGAIRFLVTTAFGSALETAPPPPQTRQDSLRALLNLSLSPNNAQGLLESGLVEPLLRSLFDDDDDDVGSSERALSILGNLASTPEGRRAIAAAPDGIPTLIDALGWAESPGCQEKAAYVLMVMAHKSYADRTSMVESGIVSALLELTLMGTTLAQKRASRILECLRVGKGKMVLEGAVSAPLEAGLSTEGPKKAGALGGEDEGEGGEAMVSEERKAVKQLVQQSLQSNMRRIARRANLNLPAEMVVPSDRFRALASAAGSSTSKSLPF
ncbi:hypothetical protein QJS10_CPB19g00682 [Acorus calamus]|uniref:U-box domain-containing protein n=1 Tax=Acorus calamus TaxID=4465 RepID=A0AAV9CH20_ACOCL|nr:hypothetical protein QJS10_CPB19g00682 [Acorus calamus]